MTTVAIIGGGFSGTMTAVNLARLSSQPVRIVVVNHRHPVGRGVAYGTPRAEHLLNVAARNMSAVPDHPDHFVDWLRTRVEYASLPEPQIRETYAPRRVYGDYLRSLLFNYVDPLDDHHPAHIELIDGEAVDVIPEPGGGATVSIEDGCSVLADRVLLATGNQPPSGIGSTGESFAHPAYVAEPWSNWHQQLPEPGSDIIVLGTGLSMVDVFLTLGELNWSGNIIAISRNGMIPQAHFRGIEYPNFLPPDPEQLNLQQWVTLMEQHCEQLRRIGENPGIIVDRLRPHTQRIWRSLSLDEKQAFLRQYAPRWNVIRHRIAQPIHQSLTEALTSSRLRVVRGSITELSDCQQNVGVNVKCLDGVDRTFEGSLVINCTGPNAGFSQSTLPLFQNLLQRGLIRPDELDMGIDVGPDFTVTGRDGENSSFLFAIGPLMKGTLWETTAVPELRGRPCASPKSCSKL
ncbi:hydroxyacylglutathione hydrolase [bacterium]|nr:hydroxyacylglutathione hydrolase [bacterium]